MGLPELTFALQKAADTVSMRVSNGVVALILRDAKANGVYTIHRESDIPTELGQDNAAAIKRAITGYINQPTRVYVSVISPEAGIAEGFTTLASYNYDYLAGPLEFQEGESTTLAGLVKEQRKKRFIGKVVLPDTEADDEGVINFTAENIKVGNQTFTAAQYAGRIAGMLAGTPSDCSATSAALPEVTGVDAIANPDAAVDAGKLILVNDGRQVKLGRAVTSKVKLGRAVTSKVKLGDGEDALLKKIKLVGAVDLIRYYAITAVEDQYLGKCANSYDNKCILLAAFRDFFETLEGQSVLLRGSSGAELDAAAIREYLLKKAEDDGDTQELARVKALSDEELRKEDTGSHVFLFLYGKVLDAMEDFHIILEAQ